MKSKTSFFNLSLLRKDIVRFAPTWVLYGAFLILIFSGDILSYDRNYAAESLGDSIKLFGLFNLGYALLCAQLLFGDLHNSRMCNALHALPVRRESWFLTHVAAGMLFAIIPVCAAGLIFLAVLGKFWMVALLWMAALILQFVVFFSIGALSMILTGNRFAALVVYTIINFIVGIVLWLFYALYVPHLHGMIVDPDPWLVFCPVAQMLQYDWLMINGSGNTATLLVQEGWGYLGICTGIALVIHAGTVLLYRKRDLETAGDFMAFRPLQPVFLVLYTFSAGAALHLFSQLFIGESTEMIFLLVGLTIGFFTGLMLLRRTLRVFRVRTFVQLGAILAIFGLTLLLTVLDPFGVTRWVPKAEDVRSVVLDRMYSSNQTDYAITDPALIEQVIAVHQHGVDNRDEGTNGVEDVQINIYYTMKSGQKVAREYYIDIGTVAAVTLEYVMSQPECVFGSNYPTAESLLEDVSVLYIYNEGEDFPINAHDELLPILQALYKDAENGNLVQHWSLYHDNGSVGYSISIDGKARPSNGYNRQWWSFNLSAKSVETIKALKPYID